MILIDKMDKFLNRFMNQNLTKQFFYITTGLIIIIWFRNVDYNEVYNFITAFIIIDISNTERKNLNLKEKTHFYDSISLISRSLLCGFIAPLFFVLSIGNNFALVYTLLYNLSNVGNYNILKIIFNILSIIPSFITQALLYAVYLIRNRKIQIDFKGDYFINSITRPLLNIDILGAYIESVNFYYHFNDNEMHFIKSYGEYTNRIDKICIRDYLSISYGICIVWFLIFFMLIRLI